MHQLSGAGSILKAPAAGLLATFLLLVACASTPPEPTSALTAAQDAITVAEQSGASRYARSELDEARQKLNDAELAVDAEEMVKAQRHAEEARVSAELATARANADKAEEINREVTRGNEALIEELRRQGDRL